MQQSSSSSTLKGVLTRNPYIRPKVAYSTLMSSGQVIELVAFNESAEALAKTASGQAISVDGSFKFNQQKQRYDFIVSSFDAIAIISSDREASTKHIAKVVGAA